VNDDSDVNVIQSGEFPERSDDLILLPKTVHGTRIAHPHHELEIVYDDVSYIVDVNSVRTGLWEEEEGQKKRGGFNIGSYTIS
jgi:hypothetical protein